jgi:hypothetical protein
MTEHDLADVFRSDARMFQRFSGYLGDQTFQRFAFQLAEARMRPADDTCGQDNISLSVQLSG